MGELPEQPTVEQLAAQAQHGRPGAFDELARRVSPWLLRYLQRSCPTPQDAEDLCQETFLKAYQSLHRYDPGRPIRPWLKTIAARLRADHARRARVRRAQALAQEPAGRVQPTEALRAGDLWRVARALLSERQFTVLQLRYQEQRGVAEIARQLGLSRSNVKVILFRARKALADSPDAQALLDESNER